MSCKELHEEFVLMEEIICPYCDKKIGKRTKKIEQCCSQPEIVNDNNMLVCKNCGIVNGYKPLIEYVEFHQNKHRFHRKSVYQRKYHIENIINNVALKNNFQISVKNKDKILRIFMEVGTVINLVNKERKRMININFILQKIFKMLNLPYEKIKITKSKKTLQMYNEYWNEILSIISDKIIAIIRE